MTDVGMFFFRKNDTIIIVTMRTRYIHIRNIHYGLEIILKLINEVTMEWDFPGGHPSK
jgi:hypothetical protein